MHLIAGFGNALIDITVKIECDDLLLKYKLIQDGQIELSEQQLSDLLEDITKYSAYYSAGGCAQNTIRVIQWLLHEENTALFYGSIGRDKMGVKLQSLLESVKVSARYTIYDEHPTGVCVALVNGEHRTLVASIGASQYYNHDDVQSFHDELKDVQLIYVEGFFLPNRLEFCRSIIKYCEAHGKVLAFNLCAPYICLGEAETVQLFVRSSDIIFGNHKEYAALGTVMNVPEPIDVARSLNENKSEKCRYGKTVVVTNGSAPIQCIHANNQYITVESPPIAKDKIEDTTGAGDSFAGGFLASYLMGHDIGGSLRRGIWTAQTIIGQVGCTVPDFVPNLT